MWHVCDVCLLFYYCIYWTSSLLIKFFIIKVPRISGKMLQLVYFGLYLNPIRSGLFQTFMIRGGGGGFKSPPPPPPPYDLENYCVNRHHIIHVNFTRCFRHDPIGIFQKFAILIILQRFLNKK